MVKNETIIIHPHMFIKSTKPLTRENKRSKHFIFDLDETLGSFSEFFILWKALEQLSIEPSKSSNQEYFDKILTIFPEFWRPGIFTILRFLLHKKTKSECGNVYIYTNNKCSKSWPIMIQNYIEKCMDLGGLFDKIICSFKINNTIVESLRTTQEKTCYDIIKCTLLPINAEMCFIDNSYHPQMLDEKVFYIQPKSYFHNLNMRDIIVRMLKAGLSEHELEKIHNICIQMGCSVNDRIKSIYEQELDILISKKLMYYIQDFFYLIRRRSRTHKIRSNYEKILGNFTRKCRK
jgi:hypothetical protein